tara:strand:- start:3212 stop:3940 length:729 start_codon:yes stop_codon:yes gene_type:complete
MSEYDYIMSHFGEGLSNKVYNVLNDITSIPLCGICNSRPCTYNGFKEGYSTTCGMEHCKRTCYGWLGTRTFSSEEREALSKRMKENNPMKDRVIVSKSHYEGRDYSLSEETKKRLSIAQRNFYNRLSLNEEYGYLYIIQSDKLGKLKIGITNNFESRFKEIQRDFGECILIKLVENVEYNKLAQLEQYLQITYDDSCQPEKTGGGKTEWFGIEIKEVLLTKLNYLIENKIEIEDGKERRLFD